MNILGHFKYHIYEVKLESSDDEKEYKVTIIKNSLGQRTEPEVTVHPFLHLNHAYSAFENAVIDGINHTSFSDVSLYMQQG